MLTWHDISLRTRQRRRYALPSKDAARHAFFLYNWHTVARTCVLSFHAVVLSEAVRSTMTLYSPSPHTTMADFTFRCVLMVICIGHCLCQHAGKTNIPLLSSVHCIVFYWCKRRSQILVEGWGKCSVMHDDTSGVFRVGREMRHRTFSMTECDTVKHSNLSITHRVVFRVVLL